MPIKLLDNEIELLAKIAKGDTQAFTLVYEHYRKRVYTVSLQYLRSEILAEDAMQEIFLKLWTLTDHLTEVRNLEAYLMQLTKYKCLNMLRRLKLEFLHIEALPEKLDVVDSATENHILLNDTQKVLNEGIALLPPQQKLVYQLCQIEGMKYGDVAKKLQLSPETVRSHLKLALRFLRNHIGKNTDITILGVILNSIIVSEEIQYWSSRL